MNPPALFLDHRELNFKATELRLGLPGTGDPETTQSTATSSSLPTNRSKINNNNNNKRASPETEDDCGSTTSNPAAAPSPKAQVVGWPPIRSYRKKNYSNNNDDTNSKNNNSREHHVQGSGGVLVKVSVDGAPYLRKIDLKVCRSYGELLMVLEAMFGVRIGGCMEREGSGKGSDYDMTYKDRDGDWMLAGDVPWEMFVSSCKRLRIMRSSEVKGSGYHL
ncbi:Auxin-induced protein 22D-like protein [Drosera capensis]